MKTAMLADPLAAAAAPSDLADRIRRGEPAAFEAFFRAEYAALCSFLRSQVATDVEAEEIAQDVMLRLWQARERLRAGASLRPYLYRSARNAAINHRQRAQHERRWKERTAAEPAVTAPWADADLHTSELAAAASAAIASLPERCRLIFELSRRNHLTHAEIAESLDLSRKTVEAQIGRALKLLRERLAPFLE